MKYRTKNEQEGNKFKVYATKNCALCNLQLYGRTLEIGELKHVNRI